MWSCLLFWLVVWNTLDVIKSNKTKDFIRCYKDHMVFTLHAKLYKVQSLRSPTRSNCRVFIFHVLQIIDSSQLEQLLTYSMPREDILSWLYWSAHNIWGMLYLLIVNCIYIVIDIKRISHCSHFFAETSSGWVTCFNTVCKPCGKVVKYEVSPHVFWSLSSHSVDLKMSSKSPKLSRQQVSRWHLERNYPETTTLS